MSQNKLRPPDKTTAAIAEPRITDVTYQRRAEALEAERDQLRQQVEKLKTAGAELLEASAAAHPHTATSHQPRLYRANHAMKKALDQVRKELDGR